MKMLPRQIHHTYRKLSNEKGTVVGFALTALLLLSLIIAIGGLSMFYIQEMRIRERLNHVLRSAEGNIGLWTESPDSPEYLAALHQLLSESAIMGETQVPGVGRVISSTLLNYGAGTNAWFAFLPPGECARLDNGKIVCNSHMCSLPDEPRTRRLNMCYACSNSDEDAKPRMFACDKIPSGWHQCSRDNQDSNPNSTRSVVRQTRLFDSRYCAQSTSSDSFLEQNEEFPTEVIAVIEASLFGNLMNFERKVVVTGYPRLLVSEAVAESIPEPVCSAWVQTASCPSTPLCGDPDETYHIDAQWTCDTPLLGCRAPETPSAICSKVPPQLETIDCTYQLCVAHRCKSVDCAMPGADLGLQNEVDGRMQICHLYENDEDKGAVDNDLCNNGAGCNMECLLQYYSYECVPNTCLYGEQITSESCHLLYYGYDYGPVAPTYCDPECLPSCSTACEKWIRPSCVPGQYGCPLPVNSCPQDCNPWVSEEICPAEIPCDESRSHVKHYTCPSGDCCGPQPPDEALDDNSCQGEPCPQCLYRVVVKLPSALSLTVADGGDEDADKCAYTRKNVACQWKVETSPQVAYCSESQCAHLNNTWTRPSGCNSCQSCSPGMCYHLNGAGYAYDCLGTLMGCSVDQVGMCGFGDADIPTNLYRFGNRNSCKAACRAHQMSQDEADDSCNRTFITGVGWLWESIELKALLEAEALEDSDCCETEATWGYFTYNSNTDTCTPFSGSVAGREICDITVGASSGTPISLLLNKTNLTDIPPVSVKFPLVKHPEKNHDSVDWYGSKDSPLLVFDPEHLGKIESAEQLFGNRTFGGKTSADGKKRDWKNGYEALASLDKDSDNALSDKELTDLGLWSDINRDGISQAGEVQSLGEAGVTKLYVKGTRVDEKNQAIYAEPGFMRELADGRVEVGSSVDWRSAQYSLVKQESTTGWRASVLKDGATLTMPKLLTDKGHKNGHLDLSSEAWTGNWEFVLTDWPTSGKDKPSGILTIKTIPGSPIVRGISNYQENYYNAEGELVIKQVMATLRGRAVSSKSGNEQIEFRLFSKDGPGILSVAALSPDGQAMRGTSRTISKNQRGQEFVIDYDWVARRKAME